MAKQVKASKNVLSDAEKAAIEAARKLQNQEAPTGDSTNEYVPTGSDEPEGGEFPAGSDIPEDEVPQVVINGRAHDIVGDEVRRKRKTIYLKGTIKSVELPPRNGKSYAYNFIFSGVGHDKEIRTLFFNFDKLPVELKELAERLETEPQDVYISVVFEELRKGITTFEYDGVHLLDIVSGWYQLRIFNVVSSSVYNEAKEINPLASAQRSLMENAIAKAQRVLEDPTSFSDAEITMATKLILG